MPAIKLSQNNEKETLNIWWLGIFLFTLAIAAPWFNTSIANHSFVKSYFAVIGSGTLFLASIYLRLNATNTNWQLTPIKTTLSCLFALGFLSIFWSSNFDFSVTKLILWFGAFFSFIVGLNLSTNKEYLTKLAWCLVLSGGIISAIGVLQFLFDPFMPLILKQAAMPASTFGNKNMATQPTILILPLVCYLIFSKLNNKKSAWVLVTSGSLMLSYLFYTTTRAAWLAFSVEMVLILAYIIINRNKIKQWHEWNNNKRDACIFGAVLTLLLINLSADGFTNFLLVATETTDSVVMSAQNSTSPRFQIWQTATNMISDSPIIGTGLGTYPHNLGTEGYATGIVVNFTRVHNDLLELAVELGLIGIVIFLSVMATIIASVVAILKQTEAEIHCFFYLLFAALIGSFINLQFSFPYQMAAPLVLFGLYSGLIAKQYDMLNGAQKAWSFAIKPSIKKLIFGFWILVFFFIIAIFTSWINMYSNLSDLNSKGQYRNISIVETPIYHQDLQNLLNTASNQYFSQGDLNTSSLIDNQILTRWPNHPSTLFRRGYAEQKYGSNSKALEYADTLERVEIGGLFGAKIIQMSVQLSQQQTEKFLKTYNNLLSQPENLLSVNSDTYHYLLFFTLGIDALSKHAPNIYDKYVDHHGYSCIVENNIAIHYYNTGKYTKSAQHMQKIIDRGDLDCTHPTLLKLLKDQGLIKNIQQTTASDD